MDRRWRVTYLAVVHETDVHEKRCVCGTSALEINAGVSNFSRRRPLMTDINESNKNADMIAVLNRILELELAGVVRYLHYSFMIFGHNRIPICKWLREQSDESKMHALLAGEHITTLGGHPSLRIGELLETHQHSVDEILKEALAHETVGLDEYRKLLKLAEGRSILIEEYARDQIAAEEMHLAEISKMCRR
jgi:bacterioferritin